jgi:hypothetical protein
MNLPEILKHLENDTVRHARALPDARGRHDALAPYEGTGQVRAALAAESPLGVEARNAIVVALLTEHQRARHPLWPALLACAFGPMLLKLRRRIGRPRDEDYDQRVLAALIEAIGAVRPSPYVLLAIRRATEESLFRGLRAEQAAPETLSYDEERHAADPFGPEAQAKTAAVEIARILEDRGDAELFGALVATYVNEESLRDHVARTRPEDDEASREAVYQRLWLARSQVTRELRERLRPTQAKARAEAA